MILTTINKKYHSPHPTTPIKSSSTAYRERTRGRMYGRVGLGLGAFFVDAAGTGGWMTVSVVVGLGVAVAVLVGSWCGDFFVGRGVRRMGGCVGRKELWRVRRLLPFCGGLGREGANGKGAARSFHLSITMRCACRLSICCYYTRCNSRL